jgi:hypothetical protein
VKENLTSGSPSSPKLLFPQQNNLPYLSIANVKSLPEDILVINGRVTLRGTFGSPSLPNRFQFLPHVKTYPLYVNTTV